MGAKPKTQPAGRIPPLALNEADAAKALGIGLQTLRALRADETSGIPYFRIGARLLYPVDELRAWLKNRVERR